MKSITAKPILSLYTSVVFTGIVISSAFGQTLVTKTAVLEDLSIAFNVQPNFSSQTFSPVPAAFVALTSTEVIDLTALPVILPGKLAQPTANLESRAVRFPLTCGQEGFQNYFAPKYWKSAQITGDGGVDVTGAPESKLLVQTTNDALVEVANHRDTRFSVVVPVDGYVSFSWRALGGSYFSPTAPLLFAINAKPVALSSAKQGFYLQAGDLLTWELNPAALPATVALEHWHFSCDATEILVREWYQPNTNIVSHRAYLALVRPELTSIQFPADGAVAGTPDPARSGFPFIDCDGNPYTTADQLLLNKTTPALAVYWEDVRDEEHFIVYRHWTIEDKCGNNVRRHIQKIQLASAVGSPQPMPAPNANDHLRLPRHTNSETDQPSLKLF